MKRQIMSWQEMIKTKGLIRMNEEEIKKHWDDWAQTYGTSLRATTKTSTAKALELDALTRVFKHILRSLPVKRALEAGCGNGQNCFHLSQAFPDISFTGIDFIPKMIESAREVKNHLGLKDDRLLFLEGNVLDLQLPESSYDIVYTDRCLINLNSDDLQKQAISALASLLPSGGYLIMIENSRQTYAKQNRARELVQLPPRKPAEFNHFFDEEIILPHLKIVDLEFLKGEDFISLHDLILYVLVPAINGGTVDYQHPLVDVATRLNMGLSSEFPGSMDGFGQNRLYMCRKI